MRIAYACHWNPYIDDGVVRKIRAQTTAWTQLGGQVEVFCLTSATPDCHSAVCPVLLCRRFTYHNASIGRGLATTRMARAIERWEPDVLYLRYTPLLPPPIHLL